MGPDGKHWPGCYTYWSVRAGNRQYNAGLRLDYFVVSKSLFEKGMENVCAFVCVFLCVYVFVCVCVCVRARALCVHGIQA